MKIRLLVVTVLGVTLGLATTQAANAHSYRFDRDWAEHQEFLLQTDVPEYDGFTVTCARVDQARHVVCRVTKPNGKLHVKLVYHRYALNRVRIVFFMGGVSVDEIYIRYYR